MKARKNVRADRPCGYLYVNVCLFVSLVACLSDCRSVCQVVDLSAPSFSFTTFGLHASVEEMQVLACMHARVRACVRA